MMPLIAGFVILALLVVAGSVAAGDAFVDQRAVQSTCDALAVAAGNALDDRVAFGGGVAERPDLPLTDQVRDAVTGQLSGDPSGSGLSVQVSVNATADAVTVRCTRRMPLAFGSLFGFGDGVDHVATATARAALR